MSRFISNLSEKIELGNEEFIEVRKSIPFAEMEPVMLLIDSSNEIANIKIALPLLKAAVVGWNLKDDEGNAVEFSKENIDKLNMQTILEVLPKLTEMYFPKKKELGK